MLLSLTEAASRIRSQKLSPLDLTQLYLRRIERLNPVMKAFITVTADLALDQARQAEAEIIAGHYRGPLHGIPIALKDLIDLAGVPTTAASRQYQDRVPREDAAIVTRLKQAGALIVGKTNLHEFAFGGSGVVSAFDAVRNPWDRDRIAGGSSSGSAAAVAAGMCVAAIGTDTAGSARIPAALCGLVAYRPSQGTFDMRGVVPLSRSFDTLCPMARTVEDAQLLIEAMAGARPKQTAGALSGLLLGVPRVGFFDALDSDVSICTEEALRVLRSLVREVREVGLKIAPHRTIFDAEIYEYHREMAEQTPERYRAATLARIHACSNISPEQLDRARAELVVARNAAQQVFETVDLVITPTVPIPAPKIEALQAMSAAGLRSFEVQRLLRNTAPFSVLYWPTVSVPCGFTREGLPVGLQISAAPGRDDLALDVAKAYERVTEWDKRVPPMAEDC